MRTKITRQELYEALADPHRVAYVRTPSRHDEEKCYFVLGKTATNRILAILYADDMGVFSKRIATKQEQRAYQYTPLTDPDGKVYVPLLQRVEMLQTALDKALAGERPAEHPAVAPDDTTRSN